MATDYEALREAVRNECYAAAVGAGIGGALIDAFDAENASDDELEAIARRWNIDPEGYEE